MGVPFPRAYRRWPILLLFAALLLLVLTVLLMHRSYRGQIDASMARLHQSVAATQALQTRLAERLRAANTRLDTSSGVVSEAAGSAQHPQGTAETPAAAAERLRAVAAELERIAGMRSADAPETSAARRHPSRTRMDALGLDWAGVRIALRDLQHAIRRDWLIGSRHRGPVSTHQRLALREWLSRSRVAASREEASALRQALMAIGRILDRDSEQGVWSAGASEGRPHRAPDLAQRAAALHSAITPSELAPRRPAPHSRPAQPLQTLERLAQETAAIARSIDPARARPSDARPDLAGASARGRQPVARQSPEPRPEH